MQKRYNDYATFLKGLFAGRVQKLSIDGGFTCPNRDGLKGWGGCTFCNNESFNPDYCRQAGGITRQIDEGIRFFEHKYKEQKYLAYFQAYSGTYASLDVLRQRYEEALGHPRIVGLVVGTRPDVVSVEVLDYLEDLAKRFYVCVEYGVESTNDAVLREVNRGHGFAESEEAIRATAGRGIVIGAHLIFGLPGEDPESMLEGVDRLCELPIDVLKLHQLQIVKGTRMAEQFLEKPEAFRLYSEEEYLDFVVRVIERMPERIYLERFVNQSPPGYLIAPQWGTKNFEFTAKLDKRLERADSWQGKWYKQR